MGVPSSLIDHLGLIVLYKKIIRIVNDFLKCFHQWYVKSVRTLDPCYHFYDILKNTGVVNKRLSKKSSIKRYIRVSKIHWKEAF